MLKPEDLKINIESQEGNKAVFSFEPLPQTYGHTLGNTIHRILQTSMKGAAPTQVKFNGAVHQFATLPGVKEDVVELTLNFKSLRAKVHVDTPVIAKISKTGKGKVTAKDIEVSSDAEILNKDLILATLTDDKAKFECEITLENGTGYSPVEDRETSEIGVILLDAMFSPIVQTSYKVEATRHGRDVDLDKLLLTIETDGSLTPEEALTNAANILRDFFCRFADGKDEEVIVEVSEGIEIPEARQEDVSLEELPLPTRTINALRKEGIETLNQLSSKSDDELADIKNLGDKSIEEIKKLLEDEGLRA